MAANWLYVGIAHRSCICILRPFRHGMKFDYTTLTNRRMSYVYWPLKSSSFEHHAIFLLYCRLIFYPSRCYRSLCLFSLPSKDCMFLNSFITSHKWCFAPIWQSRLVSRHTEPATDSASATRSTRPTHPSPLSCTSFTCPRFWIFWIRCLLLLRSDGVSYPSSTSITTRAFSW